jgi:uncharacterized protein (TIGR02271 family)
MANVRIDEGMTVRSVDGEKLGKVVAREASGFVVEKGFFFPKDFFVRNEEIEDVAGDEVRLRSTAAVLREGAGGERRAEPPDGGRSMTGASEEVRVPVAEEELVAEKRTRQAGEVRVHKDVRTEHRSIDVPVTKEEVRVERVPASGEARPGDATFQEGTVSVPVREEEVEVRKRPVVREEVRVSKTGKREERRADAEVRKESVDIEREGDVTEGGRAGFRGERED